MDGLDGWRRGTSDFVLFWVRMGVDAGDGETEEVAEEESVEDGTMDGGDCVGEVIGSFDFVVGAAIVPSFPLIEAFILACAGLFRIVSADVMFA